MVHGDLEQEPAPLLADEISALLDRHEGLGVRVLEVLRAAYESSYRQDVGRYVKEIVRQHPLRQKDIARIIGHQGASAIQEAMKGKISGTKLDLLREYVGPGIPFPPSANRRASAMLAAIHFIDRTIVFLDRADELSQEEYEYLRRTIQKEWLMAHDREDREQVQKLFEQHKSVIRGRLSLVRWLINILGDVYRVADRWNRSYACTCGYLDRLGVCHQEPH